MNTPAEPRLSATKLFVIVSGAIAFFVDVYALLQIIGQVHLPSAIAIPLPTLPEIQFVTANSLNIQAQDVTLLLLIYVILTFIILVGKYSKKSYPIDDDNQTAWAIAGIHFILLLVFLWLYAFSEIPSPVFNFLAEVWILSSIILLFLLNMWLKLIPEVYEGRFFGLLVLLIPLWIFLQKSVDGNAWLWATFFVLSVMAGAVLYLAGIYVLVIAVAILVDRVVNFY